MSDNQLPKRSFAAPDHTASISLTQLELNPTVDASNHSTLVASDAIACSRTTSVKVTAYDIFDVFTDSGEIYDLWQRLRSNTFILQFQSLSPHGIRLLSQRCITIAGQVFFIDRVANEDQVARNALDQYAIDELLLHSPPHQKSPLNILNSLNDDCLLAIFEPMHLLDLCAVADVCERFRRLAVWVFVARYRGRSCHLDDLKCGGGEVTLSQIERYLHSFGPAGVTFDRYDCQNTEVFLRLIAKHKANLIELRCTGLREASLNFFKDFRPTMQQLRKVSVNATQIADEQFGAGWRLESLCVERVYGECLMPAIWLPELVELEIKDFDMLNESLLRNLLARNSRVRVVRLIRGDILMRHLYLLSRYLPRMTELHLSDVAVVKDVSSRRHRRREFCKPFFGSLRRLVIDEAHSTSSIQPLLQVMQSENVRVEEVILKRPSAVDGVVMKLLKGLQTITKLAITEHLDCDKEEFVRFVRQMKHIDLS